MIIERKEDEVIIRLPSSIDTSDLEEMIDYIRYKEIASKSKATSKDAQSLIKAVKKDRWKANRYRLLEKK